MKLKKNKIDQTNLVQLWDMILCPVVCRAIHDMCIVRVVGIKSEKLCHWWNCFRFVQIAGFKIQVPFDHYHGLDMVTILEKLWIILFPKLKDHRVFWEDSRVNSQIRGNETQVQSEYRIKRIKLYGEAFREASASKWKTVGSGLVWCQPGDAKTYCLYSTLLFVISLSYMCILSCDAGFTNLCQCSWDTLFLLICEVKRLGWKMLLPLSN